MLPDTTSQRAAAVESATEKLYSLPTLQGTDNNTLPFTTSTLRAPLPFPPAADLLNNQLPAFNQSFVPATSAPQVTSETPPVTSTGVAINIWPRLSARASPERQPAAAGIFRAADLPFRGGWQNAQNGEPGRSPAANLADGLFNLGQNAARAADGGAESSSLLSLYSQSLASQFSASSIITRKFNGEAEYWPQFWSLWQRADATMRRMLFSESNKYLQLISVLGGTARNFVNSLNPANSESYSLACYTLYEVYKDNGLNLQNMVFKFVTMPQCTGSIESKLRTHSNVVSYLMSTESIKAKSHEIALAYELSALESKLDPKWKEKFRKWLEKKRDPSLPLGYSVTMSDIVAELHRQICQEAKENSLQWAAAASSFTDKKHERGGGREGFPQRRFTAAAAATAPPQAPGHANAQSGNAGARPKQPKFAAVAPQSRGQQAAAANTQRQGGASDATSYAAAASARSFPRNDYSSSAPRVPSETRPIKRHFCPFCVRPNTNGTEFQYSHFWPRQCVLIREGKIGNEEVRNIVRASGLCKNCFLKHGRNEPCTASPSTVCNYDGVCKGRHHFAFHFVETMKNRGQQPGAQSGQQPRRVRFTAAAAANATSQ